MSFNPTGNPKKNMKLKRIEQIKISRCYGNMYCVSMYIGGKLVDAVNGITEAQKSEYQQLFDNGELYTPTI